MTDKLDAYADELERKRQLEEWRKRKKDEADERVRQQKRDALEAYLKRRADEWVATTGSTDGLNEELPRWRAAYLDAREAEAEAARAERLAQLEAEHYNRL